MSDRDQPVDAAAPVAGSAADSSLSGERITLDDAAQVVEDDIARIASERDEYLDSLRRLQADFENYKKRIIKQQTEHLERAAEDLVEKLLPVLDTFELALAHGGEGLDQVHATLMGVLEKEGLERIHPEGKPFDPNEHDAVAHDQADGEHASPPQVTDVMRSGYRWKGKLLRPAMVKVKG